MLNLALVSCDVRWPGRHYSAMWGASQMDGWKVWGWLCPAYVCTMPSIKCTICGRIKWYIWGQDLILYHFSGLLAPFHICYSINKRIAIRVVNEFHRYLVARFLGELHENRRCWGAWLIRLVETHIRCVVWVNAKFSMAQTSLAFPTMLKMMRSTLYIVTDQSSKTPT